MNIKGLLLGSAAALVVVSGARAADAVTMMAEPEPMEYVRVCDTYGTGYFYIPGTETCLKFSGHVWYQIGSEGYDGTNSPDYLTYGSYPGDEGWIKQTRVRFEVDARESTEWGTLRANIRFQAEWGNGAFGAVDGPVVIDQAILQLGGLRMGYTESVWNDSIGAGVASYGSHSWGSMSYGYQQRHGISYTFGSDQGFAATISLEDDNTTGTGGLDDGYMPDIVIAASYNASWGAVWFKAGYDEYRTPVDVIDDDGFGVLAGMQLNVPGFEGSSFRLIGYYSDSDNAFGVGSPVLALTGGYGASEWSVLASYYHQFTDTFGASVGFQYFSDYYFGNTAISSGIDGYEAELNLVWTPIDNLEIRSEIYYDKVDTLDGTFSGFLRFTRSF